MSKRCVPMSVLAMNSCQLVHSSTTLGEPNTKIQHSTSHHQSDILQKKDIEATDITKAMLLRANPFSFTYSGVIILPLKYMYFPIPCCCIII